VVLSDYADVDVVLLVKEERPNLILAVGDNALAATRKIRKTPILAVMSLSIDTLRSSKPNLIGISMFAPPKRYISVFQRLKAHRVGVVHNAARSGWYLRQARNAAMQAGIELIVREVSSPRETLDQLSSMNGKVDALWMLPDSIAVSRETIEAFFFFGQKNNVPVIAFASSYLGMGAAAVLEVDRAALGRQAGAMAKVILNGTSVDDTAVIFPSGVALKVNQSVMNLLHLSLESSVDHKSHYNDN
jgi:putative ABC transport system substrate-binding protein